MSGAVVVTGAAGFIGGHVVDALLAGGSDVIAVDRPGRAGAARARHRGDPRLQIVDVDVAELEDGALPRALEIAAVIHLAAQIFVPRSLEDPIGDVRDNVIGSLRCFEVARRRGAKLVLASSAAVYGEVADGPVGEGAAAWPRSPYGVDKLAAEMHLRVQARERGLRGIALRFFNVYGPRQDPRGPYAGVIARFVDRARRGEALEIFGDGAQTRDFVFIGDVVAGILAACARGPEDGSAVNLGSGIETSIHGLARAVVEVVGATSPIVHRAAQAGEVRRSCAAIERARDELGYRPQTSLEDGLRALVSS
ncbi:MAG: NAD-dependent epimerase/dehydratase family protein [Nannocystaceae bacterium]